MKIQDGQTHGDYWYWRAMKYQDIISNRERHIREQTLKIHDFKTLEVSHDITGGLITEQRSFHWECVECEINTKEITIEELIKKCPL